MKWILIFVLYSQTMADDYRSSSTLNTTTTTMVFDDEQACASARDGLNSGAFNKSFSQRYSESRVMTEAACVPQASTNGRGPIR